jgi:hypothetical protein
MSKTRIPDNGSVSFNLDVELEKLRLGDMRKALRGQTGLDRAMARNPSGTVMVNPQVTGTSENRQTERAASPGKVKKALE